MDKGYIDIHSHILYDIDDGAGTIEESVTIIKALTDAGFSTSIATPHNMPGNDRNTLIAGCRERINGISGRLELLKINYEILPGAENYFDASLNIKDPAGYFVPLGNSDTFLVEIPFIGETSHHISALHKTGLHCVIAHVERYIDIVQNPDKAYMYKEAGFLLQMNMGSLIGIYGFDIMKTANHLLNAGIIDVLSTDIHDTEHAYAVLKKGFKRMEAIMPLPQISRALKDIPSDILQNRYKKP
jgi:protein-tyrosine phosphatase